MRTALLAVAVLRSLARTLGPTTFLAQVRVKSSALGAFYRESLASDRYSFVWRF